MRLVLWGGRGRAGSLLEIHQELACLHRQERGDDGQQNGRGLQRPHLRQQRRRQDHCEGRTDKGSNNRRHHAGERQPQANARDEQVHCDSSGPTDESEGKIGPPTKPLAELAANASVLPTTIARTNPVPSVGACARTVASWSDPVNIVSGRATPTNPKMTPPMIGLTRGGIFARAKTFVAT